MRTALITGANRGLGYLLAEKLLSKNYRVIMTGRNMERLKQAHSQLKCIHPYFPLDVQDPISVQTLQQTLNQEKIVIDVLVNNAAILETQLQDQKHIAQQVLDVNYYGVVRVCNSLLSQLSQDAKILVLTSNLGKLNLQNKQIQHLLNSPVTEAYLDKLAQQFIKDHDYHQSFGQWNSQFRPIYSVSKALLNAYVRHILVKKVDSNQSVYAIHPGWVKTEMGGKAAPQEVEEGILTSMELIEQPFGRDQKMHGQYFNENGKLENY